MAHEQSIQQVGFDYSSLKPEARAFVEERTAVIRQHMRQTASGIIGIGHELTVVKKRIGHNYFQEWLRGEFAMSDRTARRFMQVAAKTDTVSVLRENVSQIDVSALYLLTGNSTPKKVVKQAAERASNGERITQTTVKELQSAYQLGRSQSRPAPKPSSKAQQSGRQSGDVRTRCKALLDVASDHLAQEVYEWLTERLGVSS